MEKRFYGDPILYSEKLKNQLFRFLRLYNGTRLRLANPVRLDDGQPMAPAAIKGLETRLRRYEREIKYLRRELAPLGQLARPRLWLIKGGRYIDAKETGKTS